MLHSSPYRCAETALADYLELVLGTLQDTMSNITINRYGDENLGYWAAIPEMQTLAGKPRDRRQRVCHDREKYVAVTHLLSFLMAHSSFLHCCLGFAHILAPSLLCVSFFIPSFFFMLSLVYPSFTSFHPPLYSHCLFLLLFLSLSLIHSFSSAPLLWQSSYVISISTFSWAACKGQLVGCNHLALSTWEQGCSFFGP